MKQGLFDIVSNEHLTENVMKMVLSGDTGAITVPGQFVNIRLDGYFLRRPISVCDCEDGRDGSCGNGIDCGSGSDSEGSRGSGSAAGSGSEGSPDGRSPDGKLTIIYKIIGKGTAAMSRMTGGQLDLLTGLGNGYDLSVIGEEPVLIGGGAGVPPMYWLCRKLIASGKKVQVILGFNTAAEVFYEQEFRDLGARVFVTTADGSYGIRGFVTDALKDLHYSDFCACGPEPMLKAVYARTETTGQMSFEERMGCGFGACMGCSCRTITGNKRICKDGPVLRKEEILWKD